MELEFCKHFKDATNLLLMMDHDSGYVEGVESYESDSLRETVTTRAFKEPDNFLLSEDALLEKPEICLNLGNLAYQIDNEDYEETRRLFFSPEVIPSSVKSSDSSVGYSGLENETSSEMSCEIHLQAPVIVKSQESCTENFRPTQELDISTTSVSDMSLEVSMFDPVIIEKIDIKDASCTLNSPSKTLSTVEGKVKESTINKPLVMEIDTSNKANKKVCESKKYLIDKSLDKLTLDHELCPASQNEIVLENRENSTVNNKMVDQNRSVSTGNHIMEKPGDEYDISKFKRSSESLCSEITKKKLTTPDKFLTKNSLRSFASEIELTSKAGCSEGTTKVSDVWKVGNMHIYYMHEAETPLKTTSNISVSTGNHIMKNQGDDYDISKSKRTSESLCSEITSETTKDKLLTTPDKFGTKNSLQSFASEIELSPEAGCSGPISEGTTKVSDVWKVESMHKSETPLKTTPLSTVTNTFENSKEKRRLTLVFSKNEKENGYCVKRKYPSMTPEKNYKNSINSDVSPEIFGDEMISEIQYQDNLLPPLTQLQIEEKYVNKLDKKLLKRTQKGMNGLPPPSNVTVIHMSVVEILAKLEENKSYFWDNDTIIQKNTNEEAKDTSLNSSLESNSCSKSLLVNVNLEKAKSDEWPEVLNMRYHGLYHNCSKISEEIMDLCDKYQKRFVGAESQSTCTVFQTQNLTSPTKQKMIKPRWSNKSPGRRLSHLAKRRITFSSATLQAGGSSLAGLRARQILVDAKKVEHFNRRKSPRKSPRKTPKKTPRKSPKIKTRTPSSSAKKKLAIRFRKLTGELEKSVPSTSAITSAHRTLFKSPDKGGKSEHNKSLNKSTKRALFQSPNRDRSSSLFTNKSQDFSSSGEKSQLRRALFTSPKKMSPIKGKKSPFKHAVQLGFEKKRKRSESDDVRPSKFSRSMSMDVRPSTSGTNKFFTRAQSELNISLNRSQSQLELTDQHRKKLQWAVYGALQTQNITNSHPQWKVWASVLGRVTCRFFTSQMASRGAGAKLEGGTTERMNRIARRHVLSVVKGKSVDEIISEYINSRPRICKPQGYVAPDMMMVNNVRSKISSDIKESVFQDRANTIESWEKKKLEQLSKPSTTDNKIERIRKVINFGDDR